ncbi:MAG: hypothetical protein QOJ73_2863 [Streptosporangiaceae bacterium]|jgi:hypothetical protein|nr:hypothetical protein [Streptosporangiaceae bacterium]
MTPDAQILAPPAAPGESTDPRRWLTLMIRQHTGSAGRPTAEGAVNA